MTTPVTQRLGRLLPPATATSHEREVLRLTTIDLPEYTEDHVGQWALTEEQAADLDRLFGLFGLQVRVGVSPATVIVAGWCFCTIELGRLVNLRICDPEAYKREVSNWPSPWLSYVEAIATGSERVEALASALMPLAPDVVYPPGLQSGRALFKD